MPDYLRIGGSVIFFLVMIDDYLFYFAIMLFAAWSAKQVKKSKQVEGVDKDSPF